VRRNQEVIEDAHMILYRSFYRNSKPFLDDEYRLEFGIKHDQPETITLLAWRPTAMQTCLRL